MHATDSKAQNLSSKISTPHLLNSIEHERTNPHFKVSTQTQEAVHDKPSAQPSRHKNNKHTSTKSNTYPHNSHQTKLLDKQTNQGQPTLLVHQWF